MSRLYPIVDEAVCRRLGYSVEEVFRAVLSAHPPRVQFRAKELSDRLCLTHLRELVSLRNNLSPETLLFANDRPDLAELAQVDGVHVGQGDMPIPLVRKHFPRLKVGVSTHDESQLRVALTNRPDYLALGPIFQTASKENPEPTLGLEGLKRLAPLAREAGISLVAIGGITHESLAEVLLEADQVALISAIFSEIHEGSDVFHTITETVRALGKVEPGAPESLHR
jgi:thiamine-phosphate pyrophosphorylase